MGKNKGGLHAAVGTLMLRNMMKGVLLRTHWKEKVFKRQTFKAFQHKDFFFKKYCYYFHQYHKCGGVFQILRQITEKDSQAKTSSWLQ